MTTRVFKWVGLLALACLIIGGIGLAVMLRQGFGDGAQEASVNMEKSFDLSKVMNVKVSADVSDIVLTKSEDNTMRVHLTGNVSASNKKGYRLEGSVNGDTVTVEAGSRTRIGLDIRELLSLIRWGEFGTTLEIALPAKTYQSLAFSTSTGKITLGDLTADSLKLEADTGKIMLDGFQGRTLTAKADTGSVTLRRVTGTVNASADTGRVEVLADGKSDVTLKADTGSILLELEQAQALQFDLRTDTGSVTSDIPGLSYETKERHRHTGTLGSGGPNVKVSADTGSVTLRTVR